jgi:hypothetical protein
MAYSLEAFCRDARAILKRGATRADVERIRPLMERLVVDPGFVAEYFGENQPMGLRRIYVDPETGFEMMTYRYAEPRRSQPHDHGDSWAIYAQVAEYTEMTEWERTDEGSDPNRAQLKVKARYRLGPGQAGIYFGRELHSTATPAGTRYLRITGTDLENIERLRIDEASGRIERIRARQSGAVRAEA